MGLRKDVEIAPRLLPVLIIAIALLLEVAGDSATALLRYDREVIGNGELWRLLTGHLVHLGWSHFLLNAIGLALVWALFGKEFSFTQWAFVTIVTIAGIDVGFWLLHPNLQWYVGLSGLLHGLLAAGLISLFHRRPWEAGVIGGLIVAKLIYEQVVGPLPGSENVSGGAVIVAAHLYGAVFGTVSGYLARYLIRVRPAAPL